MPGEKALALESGKYGVYYEEAVDTGENETFEPPDGIQIRVRGIGGAPDPELDLGGLGSQIGTDNRTAEEIGTLRVSEDGRYGMVVGPPPRPGVRPTITVGESSADSFLRGLKRAGIALLLTGLAVLVVMAVRKVRPPEAPPPPAAAAARAAERSPSSGSPSCSARGRSPRRSSSGCARSYRSGPCTRRRKLAFGRARRSSAPARLVRGA